MSNEKGSELRDEIETHADPADKKILYWLLDRYFWASKWSFVAQCQFKPYGKFSYQSHRVWSPTLEGRALYEHATICQREDG